MIRRTLGAVTLIIIGIIGLSHAQAPQPDLRKYNERGEPIRMLPDRLGNAAFSREEPVCPLITSSVQEQDDGPRPR